MFSQNTIDLFKDDEVYDIINQQKNIYKKQHEYIKSLLNQQGEEFKKSFVGNFLLGDYIWAM